MAVEPLIAVGAGLATLGILGSSIGIGMTAAKALEGMARQPEMTGKLFINGLIFVAFVEALGLMSFVISILLLFVFGAH